MALLFASLPFVRAQPQIDWSKAELMSVIMIDDKFEPDHLIFHHGVPYRLHLENHGKELHEFTAPEFLAASVMRDPALLKNGGQDIVVQPGATADVDLEPLNPGTYKLTCADHDWDGMTGDITVE